MWESAGPSPAFAARRLHRMDKEMNFNGLAEIVSNGFHDAMMLAFEINYVGRKLKLKFQSISAFLKIAQRRGLPKLELPSMEWHF